MENWKKNKAQNPYSVPANYFADMQKNVQLRMREDSAVELTVDLMHNKAYPTPSSDYFDQLHKKVHAKLNTQVSENQDLIPNMPYEKPQGYTPRFKSKNNNYPLYKNSKFNALVMAATFLLLVLIGGSYIQSNQSLKVEPSSLDYMYEIDEAEWANFLENEESIRLDGASDDPEVNLKGVSEQELKDYLKEEQYLELF